MEPSVNRRRRRGGRGARGGRDRRDENAAATPSSTGWEKAGQIQQHIDLDPGRWTEEDEGWSAWAHRDMTPAAYKCGPCLGQGGSAIVYKVCRVEDGKVLAGKVPRGEGSGRLEAEARLIRPLDHPNVLKLVAWHEDSALLVTEFCAYDTLQTRIDSGWLSAGRVEMVSAMQQLCSAVAYLHGQGLFHTDVKPRNVLVRGLKPLDLVLGDCGDALPIGGKDDRLRGTLSFYSPEMWKYAKHHGPSDDVWALGLTLLSMMQQLPRLRDSGDDHDKDDDEDDDRGLPRKQRRKKAQQKAEEEIKRFPGRCSKHAGDLRSMNPGDGLVLLAESMLAMDCGHRVSAVEAEKEAARLLAEGPWDGGPGLQIKAPENFQPVSFW
ncbi:hypothetical protein CDD80_5743 [Ophiocordyceps camponoti-rufipedis]|uniref:Protein kinase domain-containing protein n=1 Tax=Ophiocordyceps camponoti-rufipedis TaxID=2004952 RepID=A0A2C5XTM2_9HYPO|nr:hypothetical protein CDD80_5743 [Ophiocordyceps camponoti-rufipedis]